MADHSSSNWLVRSLAARRGQRPRAQRRPTRLILQNLEDRSVPAVALAHVNDNWNFVSDTDASNSLTVGDIVRNDNDALAPGTLTATYGVDGFGTVTSGAFTGSVAGGATIDDAIFNTNVGGTVKVLEGTYPELVQVNKSVNLLGAQAGVDARTRTGVPESVVRGRLNGTERTTAFLITASNVTIDGFTSRDQTDPNQFNAGIVMTSTTSNVTVRNNIIANNVIGLFAGSNGASLIERNLFDGNNNPGPAGGAGIYTESTVGLTIDNNEFRNHTQNSPVIFAAVGPAAHTNLTFSNNFLHENVGGVFTLGVSGGLFQGNTIKTTGGTATALTFGGADTGIDVLFNDLSENLKGLRIVDFGFLGVTPNSDIEAHFNDFSNSTTYGAGISNENGFTDGYVGTLDLSGNWWGDITGPTFAANPGGIGEILRNDFGDTVIFQPWLVYAPDSNPTVAGVQLPTSITVGAQSVGFTATNNNYRRLVNVVDLLQNGQTATLSGNFNWTEANAAAAWALGNDGIGTTADDYSLSVRANLNGVTITAASLGSARIQGPGDLAAANLEGFLSFDGGDNQNWTISNLEIFDFDLGLGFFNGPGGVDAFNNLKILNNHIRIPADLNIIAAPIDVNQNIGIHFSFGTNQTIQGNQIDIVGNGVSSGADLSSTVGMQSNTSGGNVYDGLLIDGNTLNVLNTQSANPARILGIWENGHAHTSNITVSNNQFLNLAVGNNSALNLQRAFRVTSHSSATSTVKYTGNVVDGANIGFEWLAGSTFAGNQAVRLAQNTITNSDTGLLIQSGGIANLFQNTITGSGAGGGVHVVTGGLTAAGAVTNAVEQNFISGGTGDGIRIDATAGPIGTVFNNDLGGNAGLGVNNLAATLVDASGNFWGVTAAGTVAGEVSVNVDYSPWLGSPDSLPAPGYQGDFATVFVGAASPQAGATGRIAEGVALVSTGGTVNVAAGTYAESVSINKSVSILGAQNGVNPRAGRTADGPLESLVQATGGMGFSISAPNVTVAGFSVTPGVGSNFGIAETGAFTGTTIRDNFVHGFTGALAIVIGGSDFEITGNEVFNNYAGVYLANNASNGTVSGNLIRNHIGTTATDEGSGVVLEGTNPDIAITGNEITGNRHGIYIWTGFGSDLSGTTVFNNAISGNTAGVKNTNSAVLDASGNWWGTNAAAGVAATAGTNVDFTPWLDAGTDTNPATGFLGNFTTLHVDDASPQTGSIGRVQEGVDLVTTGGVVNVHAGTYAENVLVNRRMAIGGDGPTTVISPAGGIGFDLTAAGVPVTLFDLRITGAASAIHADGPTEVQLAGVTLTGNTSGGTVTNVGIITLRTDTAGIVDDTITVTPSQFAVQGQDFIAYTGANFLFVRTGAGNDTIIVTPSVDTAIDVDGGTNTAPGDKLIVNQNGLGATITPTQVLVPGRKPVSYSNIESVSAPAAVIIDGDLLIGGTNTNDSIIVSMNAARTNIIVSLKGQVVGTFPLADITRRIIVHSNEGNDLVQVAAIVPVDAVVFAEAGSDRLFGGGGNDLLDGGAGNDSAVGGNGNDTMVGGDGRDTMVGSAGFDTAAGPDATAIWRINGVGSGTVNTTTSFRLVEALTGGTGDDTFRFVRKGSVLGTINGGTGLNTLDYTFIGSGVRANLFAGTATRTGGVASMDNVLGGAGRDILVGDVGANRLVGNGGRDILIGGGGADSLVGGNGDDILIAGLTDHDASNAALENLMAEWKRLIPYSTRVRHLNRTLAGGANGASELTVATVHNDGGASDSLTGGAGADWFITFAGDATDATGTETVTAL